MVCIIDDREDIWNCAPNLITVKPYRFFTGTGDINAPPGSDQAFTHAPAIPLHENASEVEVKDTTDGKDEDVSENKESENNSEIVEDPSTKDSSDVSEKSGTNGSSGKVREVREINHNEKLATSQETMEGECNGGTMTGKEEEIQMEVCSEMIMENDNEDSKKVKNEEAEVSEKPHEDVVDGNHVEDHDDYLLYLEEILRRIHGSFYEVVSWNKQAGENPSAARVAPDLRYIVPELRRNVLNGTNLVFTGVIPTNCRPEDSQAWKIAQQFGANISKVVLTQGCSDRNKRTSHVVAARPGTEKACQALRLPNVQLVNPNWLWTCAERWEWVDERLFPVEGYHEYKARRSDTPNSSRLGTPNYEANSKNNKENLPDDSEHISEDNLKIVLNPFLNFSSGEMEAIDKEVEDLMRSSDEEDEKILGSVSSSDNSTENGTENNTKQSMEEDSPDGSVVDDVPKGKTVNFTTIKQNRTRNDDDGTPSKRRKLDFFGDDKSGGEVRDVEGSEGDFSSDAGSSGSNSGDDDMAALLEATLNHS